MNVVRENRGEQVALLKVTIAESDYNDAVDKKLREYRRKANIPGFRPGMVPMGLINKTYRKSTIAETAYRMASDAAFDYIEKEKIDYIGDVIPSSEQGDFDFDANKEHEFIFEVAFAPKVDIELSEKDKVTRYTIKISDDMRTGYRTNFMRRYGRLVDVDKVSDDEAVTGTLDNGTIHRDDAYVGLISMSADERKPFKGKKVGDKMTVNIEELYKTPSQRASILGVKEPQLAGIAPEFEFTITQIRKFAEPELNEEFFKMAFPEGNVTDEKGLAKFVDEQIAVELARESDYIFDVEMRKYLIDKASLTLPEDFLKRWLFTINEGKFAMEDIERDFPAFLDMMKWNLIQKYFAEKLGIKVDKDDMLAEAKAFARGQFAQYGMNNVDDDTLTNYANSILGNKEETNKILDRLYEKKIIEGTAPLVKIVEKSVTPEELNKVLAK